MSEIKKAFGEALEAVGEVKEDLKELKDMVKGAQETVVKAYDAAKEMTDLDPEGKISIEEYLQFCEEHIRQDKIPASSEETLKSFNNTKKLLSDHQREMEKLDKKVKAQKKTMRGGNLSDKAFDNYYALRRDLQYAQGIETGLIYRLGCAAKVLFHEIKFALGAEAGH